jgi:hypothetical protein
VIIGDLQVDLLPGQLTLIQELDLVDIPTDAAVGDHLLS